MTHKSNCPLLNQIEHAYPICTCTPQECCEECVVGDGGNYSGDVSCNTCPCHKPEPQKHGKDCIIMENGRVGMCCCGLGEPQEWDERKRLGEKPFQEPQGWEKDFPTKLAMEITDIVLNKEKGWSRKLEQTLETAKQEWEKERELDKIGDDDDYEGMMSKEWREEGRQEERERILGEIEKRQVYVNWSHTKGSHADDPGDVELCDCGDAEKAISNRVYEIIKSLIKGETV